MIAIVVSFFMDVKKHMLGLNTDGTPEVEEETPPTENEKAAPIEAEQPIQQE